MSTTWENMPRPFEGKTVFVVGGGPSLFDIEEDPILRTLLAVRNLIAVNGALKLFPEAKVHFFSDAVWYWREKARIDAFTGMKITTNKRHVSKGSNPPVFNVPSLEGQPDLVILPRFSFGWAVSGVSLPFNRSSGACAINLAALLGASRIVLVGFDMRSIEQTSEYFCGDASVCGRVHDLGRWTAKYPGMLEGIQLMVEAKQRRNDQTVIVNATAGSSIPWFPFVDLMEEARNG